MATAKLFKNGRSQAVRLPAEFRFEGTEVQVERDAASGRVTLYQVPTPKPQPVASDVAWDEFLDSIDRDPAEADPSLNRADETEEQRKQRAARWKQFFELARKVQEEEPIPDDFPYRDRSLPKDRDIFG